MAGYPRRFSPQLGEVGPSPLVLGRRYAAGPAYTEFSVQGVCPEDEEDSWAGFCPVQNGFHSCVPLNK